MSLTSYLEALTNAQSMEALWDMHCRKMADYGFDRIIYGYTHYRTTTSLGDPEDFVILTNHSKAYTDFFMGQSQYFHAPMVKWALENEGACSWSIVADMLRTDTLTPSERHVLAQNKVLGVTAGYTVSFKSISPRSKGAIALTAPEGTPQSEVDALWRAKGAEILIMNNVAHLKIMTLPYSGPTRHLTKRQREAISWVGDGKTMQDIAVLMGLTVATVEKHLRLAREALSVETTAQAVLKVALQNQMFVLEM